MTARVRNPLKRYRRKRDFAVTPEPAPSRPRARRGAAPTFVVHKHDARRLHYDLRLEMGGALASWAVPKGPSYDPRQRRLAVRTEDHPLEYASFEGRIPEGEYGAGDSIVWDRGTWEPVPAAEDPVRLRDEGHLAFELHGEKLHGRWHLVRTRRSQGGKESWLLFKGKDDAASAEYDVIAERPESVATGRRITRGPERKSELSRPHPAPIDLLLAVWPPMLASLSSEEEVAPRARELVFEQKYDGFRALAGVSGGAVSLQSRNGLDLAPRFPGVARALAALTIGEAVFDGEIVALDAKGRASFQRLQNAGADARYVVFDLLWLDGQDLRSRPLAERRDLLESVLANEAAPLSIADRWKGPLAAGLADARRRGTEGLIAKRIDSRYSGGRGRDWRKLKVRRDQELAVLGFAPISSGESMIGALHVGYREGGRWRWAGKVGTGFTDRVRHDLFETLSRESVPRTVAENAPRERGAVWVEPRHVAQVGFTEWTDDGRLRQPVFLGLRDDKSPAEVVRERAVTKAREGAASGEGRARRGRRASPRARSRPH